MTLPSCLRSSIDHGFRDRLGVGRGGRWEKKKFSKLSSSSAFSDANTSPGDGWAAAPPTSTALLDFPEKDSVCAELSGARWRRGSRGCARGGARAAAERLRCQEPSLGLREVPESRRLRVPPRTALSASAGRRPPAPPRRPPTWPGPVRPLRLFCARPLALSPDARPLALSLRTQRLSRPGEPAEPAGPGRWGPARGPRSPRPAERAVIRAGAAGPPRAPHRAPWVPRSPRAPGC